MRKLISYGRRPRPSFYSLFTMHSLVTRTIEVKSESTRVVAEAQGSSKVKVGELCEKHPQILLR